jgi:hypothetical protein
MVIKVGRHGAVDEARAEARREAEASEARLRADFEERVEAATAQAVLAAEHTTRERLDALRAELGVAHEASAVRSAQEAARRVEVAAQSARLEAEARHAIALAEEQRKGEQLASAAREEAQADLASTLELHAQRVQLDVGDEAVANAEAAAGARVDAERSARIKVETELIRTQAEKEKLQRLLAIERFATTCRVCGAAVAAGGGSTLHTNEAAGSLWDADEDTAAMESVEATAVDWVRQRSAFGMLRRSFDVWKEDDPQESLSPGPGGRAR